MGIACLAAFASLRGALLFTVLASIAGAQNQTWIRQFGTTDHDDALETAPDGAGGVYVSGFTGGSLGGPSAGDFDIWLARYDAAGNQTWIQQVGTSESDRANTVAPDGAGGVFVSGETWGSLGGPPDLLDAWLAHYDGAGNRTWIRSLGTTAGTPGVAEAAPDGAGGVYVSGAIRGSLGGPNAGIYDVWLARHDSAGSQTWIRQFGTANHDFASAAAPDGAGGVYVCGITEGSLGGPNAGSIDAWLAHYDSAGNQTWLRQFGTIQLEQALAAASDGAGGVYVSGWTSGSLGGPNVGARDVWLARYDTAGNQTWIQQFGTADADVAWAAAPDGAGGVFVSGWTFGSLGGPNAGAKDAWLAHYDGLRVTRYCSPAISNSTGQPGELTATGSNTVVATNLTVAASQLPPNAFGFFLTSRSRGLAIGPGGSQGNLCLGGAIGRYVGPGQIKNSGAAGTFDLVLDPASTPTPTGFVPVQPGDTWNFQAWYRDANPRPTSNFTDAVSVTFQ